VAVSPTIRRRELGARLRVLRSSAGLTAEDVAARMEVSPAKISRLETAARGVNINDIRVLCDIYGVSADERQQLLTLARESRRRSWWQQYGLSDVVQTYLGTEDAASSVLAYETSFVPALLQTEHYALALTSGASLDVSDEQVRQRVRARLTRQERLRAEQPLELWAILDEVALVRPVGGTDVMSAQLADLADRSRLPNVTVQVVPLEAGAHPGMDSAFSLLHLEEVSDVVYVEGLIGDFYLQNANDLARYHRAFDQLRAIALSPDETRKRILSHAGRFSPS
jgi:transcriptional regulator with XRE-family HTH domain